MDVEDVQEEKVESIEKKEENGHSDADEGENQPKIKNSRSRAANVTKNIETLETIDKV